MAPKFTMVPSEFFSEEKAGELLSKVVPLEDGEPLLYVNIPEYRSTLIYTGQLPEIYSMLQLMSKITLYNKIVAEIRDGYLYLSIAQGNSLLLANCFKAPDFTTAEYFIFSALKSFQINPEVSTLFLASPVTSAQLISLCSYFKSVEVFQ